MASNVAKIPKQEAPAPDGLLAALPAVLASIGGAKKDAQNPHFKSKYATLGSVVDAIRPAAEQGVWFRQVDLERDGGAAVETFYIGHGEELSAGVTFVPADRTNAQGYGSAKTYARRYGLLNAFGIAGEDDDGHAAASAPPPQGMPDDVRTNIISLCEAVTRATGEDQVAAICQAYSVGAITDLSKAQADSVVKRLSQKLNSAKEGTRD